MSTSLLPDLWDSEYASTLNEQELLKYRSNLLGSDKRITNYGGGNTSAKVQQNDPLTNQMAEILWVKGSGGDVGTIDLDGFATLYMDKLNQLKPLYRGLEFEDEMVGYLPHCTFNLNPRAASIDTPLHAYLPFAHVDHMHPDAVIAIAASDNSRQLTQDIFGGELGWLPWQKPGYELGLMLEKLAKESPNLKGVVLENHGLFTWGDTSYDCYLNSLSVINRAISWIEEVSSSRQAFGKNLVEPLKKENRDTIVSNLMPKIRGKIGQDEGKLGHFFDGEEVLEFVNSAEFDRLAALGTSCPDHFLRTKIRPMILRLEDGQEPLAGLDEKLEKAIADYRIDYQAYYDRCKHDKSPAMRDPNPVITLIPGVGMLSFAKDAATARIAGEFYINAINVMRGSSLMGNYQALPEQEAFDIEYWLLEEAKLQRMPKPKSLAGKIAFITGGAGGIGQAIAHRCLHEGACVMLADIDQEALANAEAGLSEQFSADKVSTVVCNVTKEEDIKQAFLKTARTFGGVDILVSNAGIASSSPITETSLQEWQKNMDILSTGYFLVSREAFSLMTDQGLGGSMVFVASKNALVASKNASAYCTAKASEVQLARCLALEGADHDIRVNVVNPDAVLRGSKIWTGKWREERASAYNLSQQELEEHYRQRSMLKKNIFPEDIANATYFLISEESSKSTGNIINVDGGHAPSFTR
ncbi:bifunctional rhamnulose-1-phosphate aldolase/short-chain dehydrogenase [Endozoicomonas sp. OPT23]|uniref:bifunctional rhamnulose-1-phosphate aldolase/short-chain dehydrogenase n=1 Tax=Endozoicomonas sp. OPT23 TaxID=2072845 RepID=UPI00129A2CA7|nr:bifunctional rhamnulose-1-phosphate aldolase/short-chain dehydrogenase [Endozoicomonas sp. OPT23]MRI31502.1 bifunctional rhamnulose-1-phosphate aldolase/short-chain dehydrogenase [Endozoicomonas sp. OPT23]